jgi:hypothetical protein
MTKATASQPVFNPANFEKGQPIDNPYLPWKPGTTFLYHTFVGKKLEQIDKSRSRTRRMRSMA